MTTPTIHDYQKWLRITKFQRNLLLGFIIGTWVIVIWGNPGFVAGAVIGLLIGAVLGFTGGSKKSNVAEW